MNAEAVTSPEAGSTDDPASPPTVPSSVVWCCGRPYVLEARPGRARWMGTDRGAAQAAAQRGAAALVEPPPRLTPGRPP